LTGARNILNFPLLQDADGKIAGAYGVMKTGRDMARRVSFLIGLDGKIAHVNHTTRTIRLPSLDS
jgi:peroxiredoxin